MSLRLNGTAALTNSGSSSEAKVVPLPAKASPTLLTAMRLTEQPGPIRARHSVVRQTSLFAALRDISLKFGLAIVPAGAGCANRENGKPEKLGASQHRHPSSLSGHGRSAAVSSRSTPARGRVSEQLGGIAWSVLLRLGTAALRSRCQDTPRGALRAFQITFCSAAVWGLSSGLLMQCSQTNSVTQPGAERFGRGIPACSGRAGSPA